MNTDPWQCDICGQRFPVPSLAREHERMHEAYQ